MQRAGGTRPAGAHRRGREDRLHRRAPPAAGIRRTARPRLTTRADLACASASSASIVLSVPVILLAMIPALQFTYWQWAVAGARRAGRRVGRRGRSTAPRGSTCATAPRRWTRSSRSASRRRSCGRCTRCSSAHAGMPGMTHEFEWTVQPERRRGRTSTSRSPPASRCSCSPAATSRCAPSAGRARPCARCSSSARRMSRCAVRPAGAASRCACPSASCASATSSSCGPARRSPTDGVVVSGTSAVDASMVTGESVPVEVAAGDPVVGATVNAGGRLVVRATRVGDDTQLAQMARLVEEAQSGKAERAAARRPHLGRVRADRARDRGRDARGVAAARASRPRPRSPPPSRCSSSRARAPSDSPPRPRCSSAPAAARSSAS